MALVPSQSPANFLAGLSPGALATGDLNGDGNVDLVVANRGSDDLSVLLGDGGGSFLAPISVVAGDVPVSVVVGDFDGNGTPDAATANRDSSNITVLLNELEDTAFFVLSPDAGGDTGSVTVRIVGPGIKQGSVSSLARDEEGEIIGVSTSQQTATAIVTEFDLGGRALGPWDLIIRNPDGSRIRVDNAFTIESGRPAKGWVDVLGRGAIRLQRQSAFSILVGNSGNVDTDFSSVLLQIPEGLAWDLQLPLVVPAAMDDPAVGEFSHFAIDIPKLRADEVLSFPLQITAQAPGDFLISADFLTPFLASTSASLLPSGSTGECPVPLDDPYPIYWNPQSSPPAGYVVLYESFGGDQSVAISLGDGRVAHFLPGGIVNQSETPSGRNLSGLTVHSYSLPEPNRIARIVRPPRWSPQTAEDFRNDFLMQWGPQQDPPKAHNIFGDEVTSYSNSILPFLRAYPDTNCVGGVKHFWEGLKDLPVVGLPEGIFLTGVTDFLARELEIYWENRNCEIGDNDWSSPGLNPHIDQTMVGELVPKKSIQVVASFDPNDKYGSEGAGDERYVAAGEPLRYSIAFENLETATASAQEVLITDQLDITKVDLETLSLGPVSFGTTQFTPPQGSKAFTTTIDLRPAMDLLVRVTATLDETTGTLSWRFTSLDPTTNELPEDPFAGFLPPNITPPEGDGRVSFTISPRPELATGSVIANAASIIFDTNDPIQTPVWSNTLDQSSPESAIGTLPETSESREVLLEWSGTDQGAGIRDYTLFVSEDGQPFMPIVNSSETNHTFVGKSGANYHFYSIARDLAGNLEPAPSVADAVTTIEATSLDVDDNDSIDALTDGLLILRHSFGFRGSTLAEGAVGPDARRLGAAEIEGFLDSVIASLDIDGNGITDALTDGLLILRYLFGFRGQTLIDGVVAADCDRCDVGSIEAFIASL